MYIINNSSIKPKLLVDCIIKCSKLLCVLDEMYLFILPAINIHITDTEANFTANMLSFTTKLAGATSTLYIKIKAGYTLSLQSNNKPTSIIFSMSTYRIEQLEMCNRQMFGDLTITCQMPGVGPLPLKIVRPQNYDVCSIRRASADTAQYNKTEYEKRRASALLDELLVKIYNNIHNSSTDYNSATSSRWSQRSGWADGELQTKDVAELISITNSLKPHVERMGSILVRQLKRRDALRRQQDSHCDVITRQLSKCASDSAEMRFTIQPGPGESGYSQWAAAMKMVAQLPGGIPPEFRSRLWLTLADKHLASRKIDWPKVERSCFSEWSHPTDAELGVQIVKDLHRTGCSLFCGEDGVENQALLKRVLLAYARWNKAVGYCQGFNMLAALILQVTDKNESDSLKLMIYLIEGVLPDSYFADSLRGLSVDMAVFRELLKSRLPRLSRHLDTLQNAAKDGTTSYEPPLTNVFTMQWFLTLFCNCLPQPTVLRVWDLILLEGNEILLRTALAIWQTLADRILSVRSADEFYCIMGVLTRDLLEFGLIDANSLIKAMVSIGPMTELKSLREHYLYNINPWGPSLTKAVVDRQLKLYPRERLALDISALKKQYVKLKQRQRQAHIIFSAAISRQPPPSTPVAMNHLLLGKSALVTAKRLGPPKGSIPPARQTAPTTLHWKDTQQSPSSSSSDTELCDEDTASSSDDEDQPCQLDDNLIPLSTESDTNLMKNDNTTSAKDSASEITSNLLDFDSSGISPIKSQNVLSPSKSDEASDIFVTSVEESTLPPESDDENFDFEKFLADRVKCLKSPTNETGVVDKEDARMNFARRNSERALQIIQENSLILHRILQCQSRLSPSPPLDAELIKPTNVDKDIVVSYSDTLEEDGNSTPPPDEQHLGLNWLDETIKDSVSLTEIKSKFDESGRKSPEYGSKYTSILEKSKSLDERYNSLILNATSLHPNIKSESLEEEKSSGCLEPSSASAGTSPSYLLMAHSPIFKYSPEFKPEAESDETGICSLGKTYDYIHSLIDLDEPTTTSPEYTSKLSLQMEEINPGETTKGDHDEAYKHATTPDWNESKTCYNYLSSPSKVSSDKSDDGVEDGGVSRLSPTGERGDLSLSPSNELRGLETPGLNIKLDDFKYFKQKRSPTLDLDKSYGESSCLKSPNKIFNPFPVSLSSRQSKEVPLKLGLYKK